MHGGRVDATDFFRRGTRRGTWRIWHVARFCVLFACASTQSSQTRDAHGPAADAEDSLLLFDRARFARDDAALAQLWQRLGLTGPPQRGVAATRRVLAQLESLAQKAESLDALALVRADTTIVAGEGANQAVQGLRPLARAGRRLSPSAALRLHAFCNDALRAAAGASGTAAKIVRANMCLYALEDADPAVYFDGDPNRRPPDPSWRALVARAQQLLEEIPAEHSLAAVARQRMTDLDGWANRAAHSLPAAIEPAQMGLPIVAGGLSYDRTPILRVAVDGLWFDGINVDVDGDRAIAAILAEDRRHRITVLAPAAMDWATVLDGLKRARRSGALIADLGVAEPLGTTPAAGSQSGASAQPEQSILRIAGFPTSIAALIPGQAPVAPPREVPRGFVFDARESGGFRMIVTPAGSELRDPKGHVEANAAAALAKHRGVSGLRVAVAHDVSYGRVVAEIARVYPLVPALALEAYLP